MKINYPSRSKFLGDCEEAIAKNRDALLQRIPISITFSSGGCKGEIRTLPLTTSRSPLYGALRALFLGKKKKNFDLGNAIGHMTNFMAGERGLKSKYKTLSLIETTGRGTPFGLSNTWPCIYQSSIIKI